MKKSFAEQRLTTRTDAPMAWPGKFFLNWTRTTPLLPWGRVTLPQITRTLLALRACCEHFRAKDKSQQWRHTSQYVPIKTILNCSHRYIISMQQSLLRKLKHQWTFYTLDIVTTWQDLKCSHFSAKYTRILKYRASRLETANQAPNRDDMRRTTVVDIKELNAEDNWCTHVLSERKLVGWHFQVHFDSPRGKNNSSKLTTRSSTLCNTNDVNAHHKWTKTYVQTTY